LDSAGYQKFDKLFRENKLTTEEFDKLRLSHAEFKSYVDFCATKIAEEQAAKEGVQIAVDKMSVSELQDLIEEKKAQAAADQGKEEAFGSAFVSRLISLVPDFQYDAEES